MPGDEDPIHVVKILLIPAEGILHIVDSLQYCTKLNSFGYNGYKK